MIRSYGWQAFVAILEAYLPAAPERPVDLDQAVRDLALRLCERVLLQNLDLLDLRDGRKIGRAGFVLQQGDIHGGHRVVHTLLLELCALLASQECDDSI